MGEVPACMTSAGDYLGGEEADGAERGSPHVPHPIPTSRIQVCKRQAGFHAARALGSQGPSPA